MNVTVAGHHVEVSEALRAYVESKIAKLQRHSDYLKDVHCILTVEKLEHRAEATVHVAGSTIHADAVEENMYAAVDGLIDKLDRQVVKHKEKVTNHHARDVDKPRFT